MELKTIGSRDLTSAQRPELRREKKRLFKGER
jgi:hypothetical protein